MLLKRLLLPKYLGTRKNRLYHQSRVEFYVGRNCLTHKTALQNIISKDLINSSCSVEEISLQEIPFGINSKELIKTKGKPNFIQKKELASHNLKTLFYREFIKGIKCIIQFHFYKDQLFYGHMELRNNNYTFKEKVEDLIKSKYALDHIRNNSIVDQSGNQLEFRNEIVPILTYLTGDKQIKEEIRTELKRNESALNKKSSTQMAQILDLI